MTETEMRELVMSTFVAAWTVAQPDVPLVLENEAFPEQFDALAYLTIVPTTSTQRTTGRTGTRKVQRSGWIQCKLWSPANVGSAGLATLGDVAQGILEMKSFESGVQGESPVTTQAAQAGPGGTSTDGKFAMAVVRVSFYFFETK